MTVRPFVPTGSLRDAIYAQQPHANMLQKYGGSSARRSALNPAHIAKYGRHVLEALRFLYEKGFVLGKWLFNVFPFLVFFVVLLIRLLLFLSLYA